MKFYHKNPRAVTEKQFGNLRETLPELGDLGGIVHDLNSDEVVGGNQRIRAMGLLGVEPVIVERYDPPNDQGTVAVGYYEVNGEQFKYRAVMWTPRQCEKANVVANKAGGTWDFDTLANDFEMDDLLEWGFNKHELGLDYGEAQDPNALWEGMPEFEQEDKLGAQVIKVHFPTLTDVQVFAELIGQTITDKTKYIWFPEQENESSRAEVYTDES